MSDVIKEIRHVGEAVVAVADGEVTIEQSPVLHKSLVAICKEHSPKKLIVDLHAVPYVDSSGVGTLVEIFRRVGKYGGKMYLVGMSNMVRGVFEITKLDQFFTILDSEEEALKA